MGIEGTVNTPLGVVKKKNAILAGGALAGILGIAWYRSKQQATSTDTTGQDTSQLDQSQFDAGITGYDEFGNPIYGTGNTSNTGSSGIPVPNTGPGTFTSNAQWAQYVEQWMVANQDADPATVGNAIGKYITGQPVTAEQAQLIDAAIAIGDYPPIAGPSGNPPGIVTSNGGGDGGGGQAHNPVAGLRPAPPNGVSFVSVAWEKSQGAKNYLVTTMHQGKVINRKTVTTTKATIHGLKRDTQYTVKVHAGPSNNPATSQIQVRTGRQITS